MALGVCHNYIAGLNDSGLQGAVDAVVEREQRRQELLAR